MFFFKKIRQAYSKLLLSLLVLLPFLALAANTNNLPDFADSAGSVVSPEFERRLGKMFLNQIRHIETVVNDPEVESYIQSIGYQLASHSDNAEQSFTFFVVQNPAINAFAGPGGVIGINSGIILNSANESELAAVIAHEIAHVTQRHLARQFEQQKLLSIPTAAAMVGAILVAVANPQAGAAALAGVSGLSTQNQINFTRANEEEADRVGALEGAGGRVELVLRRRILRQAGAPRERAGFAELEKASLGGKGHDLRDEAVKDERDHEHRRRQHLLAA